MFSGGGQTSLSSLPAVDPANKLYRNIREADGVTSDRHHMGRAAAPRYRKSGFTLAEVLITLGIIGVVAAMTMPAVLNKIEKRDTSARLKKFYSAINQSISRSTIDNGPVNSWATDLIYHDADSLYDWFDNYIMQYMVVVKNCRQNKTQCVGSYKYCTYPGQCTGSGGLASTNVLYVFADGSMIIALMGGGYNPETGIVTSLGIHMRFDTNGYKAPNTLGKDVFSFKIDVNDKFSFVTCDGHKSITGGSVSVKSKRAELLSACEGNPQTCGCLLMHDGWEFKDDYPW